MKKNHWVTLTIGIAIILGIYAVPAITQTQPAVQQAATPFYVAVVDVAQIMRQHPVFMERQSALKAQIDRAEADFKQRQETIEGKRKALEASPHKPGSTEYQQQLDIISNEMADFERDARTLQRRFALENSKIMYETFQDIKATIHKYAIGRGIAQITDYRKFTPDPADPQSVAEDMDQRLVWFNPVLEITDKIIGEVYASRGMQPPPPAPATPPAPGIQPGQQTATPAGQALTR